MFGVWIQTKSKEEKGEQVNTPAKKSTANSQTAEKPTRFRTHLVTPFFPERVGHRPVVLPLLHTPADDPHGVATLHIGGHKQPNEKK